MRQFPVLRLLGAIALGGLIGLGSADVSAQPNKPLKERVKEKKKELKEKKKELKEARKEHKDRFKELKKKEAEGTLTADEKAELERMKGNRAKLKEEYKEKRKEYREHRSKHNRLKRRRVARHAFIAKWGKDFHKRPAVRAELTLHARRMARLHRIRALAVKHDKPAVVTRTTALMAAERVRHAKKMAELKGGN